MSKASMIERIEAFVFRQPVATPVAASFGIMRNRPAVFVRIETADGAFGWGEIFANWPAAGAEHRAHLLMDDIADLALGAPVDDPSTLYHALTKATHVRALQCGEWGPFRQVIAGLDIACWDLVARRRGVPVAQLIASGAARDVPTYASGIAIRQASDMIAAARARGIAAFKVKVGFDLDRDAADIIALADTMKPGERLFTDANQAWTADAAIHFIDRVESAGLGWLEEPILADAPAADWQRVKARGAIPLAGGENIAGLTAFDDAISANILTFIQPDIAKWGGLTECATVARRAIAAGRTYCPHFLGGGIGLVASAHLLAAVGGDGLLELDVNPNILRDAIAPIGESLVDGRWRIGEAAGLAIDALPGELDSIRTLHLERRR